MADAPGDHWRLLRETCPGATAMARDEVAQRRAADEGVHTARVYRWAGPTLSLGYGQDPDTVDWDACERLGVTVVRRRTGGGAILHGNDVSYGVAVSRGAVPGAVSESYRCLLTPLLDAFDRLDLPVGFADRSGQEVHRPACYLRGRDPTHDLVLDGRKVAGNAQHRAGDAVLQHGSVAVTPDHGRRAAVLKAPEASADAFREQTAWLGEYGVTADAFADALRDALADWTGADGGAWRAAERESAAELAPVYGSAGWVRRRER